MLEDIKKTLWATADKQRANMDAAAKSTLLGARSRALGALRAAAKQPDIGKLGELQVPQSLAAN